MELVICPACGEPAEVEWRQRESGPRGLARRCDGSLDVDDMSLVKIRCLYRHWFLLPACRVPTIEVPVGQRTPAPAPRL